MNLPAAWALEGAMICAVLAFMIRMPRAIILATEVIAPILTHGNIMPSQAGELPENIDSKFRHQV